MNISLKDQRRSDDACACSRISLGSSDILIIKVPKSMSPTARQNLMAMFSREVGVGTAFVLDGDIDLAVLAKS